MNTELMRKLYVQVILIVGLGLFSAGCGKKGAAKVAVTAPPPTVIVEQISEKTVPIYSDYVGQTKAE